METKLEENAIQSGPGENWAVVVVYEDTVTRDRALAVCDELVQQFWAEVEFDFNWWRETYLADSTMAREAAWSAMNADLIIFSTHAEGELSATTTAWIESWLDHRDTRDGALIGLIGTPDDRLTDATLKHRRLREFAERGGLDYLSSILPITRDELEDAIESIHHRAEQTTSVLDQILHQSPAHHSQPWRTLSD
ncbi:MAG: hypothetical protein HY298_13040 [Verrucomicrobia bacterium]|nr:hypothetical protein [Verrucomicrobiota bacterium]